MACLVKGSFKIDRKDLVVPIKKIKEEEGVSIYRYVGLTLLFIKCMMS